MSLGNFTQSAWYALDQIKRIKISPKSKERINDRVFTNLYNASMVKRFFPTKPELADSYYQKTLNVVINVENGEKRGYDRDHLKVIKQALKENFPFFKDKKFDKTELKKHPAGVTELPGNAKDALKKAEAFDNDCFSLHESKLITDEGDVWSEARSGIEEEDDCCRDVANQQFLNVIVKSDQKADQTQKDTLTKIKAFLKENVPFFKNKKFDESEVYVDPRVGKLESNNIKSQTLNTELQNKNNDLKTQNNTLSTQKNELQNKNTEQEKQFSDSKSSTKYKIAGASVVAAGAGGLGVYALDNHSTEKNKRKN